MLGALRGRALSLGVSNARSDSGADEALLKMTPSTRGRHERILREEPIDFVELAYNILDRDVGSGLLPMAADRGITVIAKRPFPQKGLITHLQRYPLAGPAVELRCEKWPQVLLKSSCRIPRQTVRFPLRPGSDTCGRIGRLCMDRGRMRPCAAV